MKKFTIFTVALIAMLSLHLNAQVTLNLKAYLEGPFFSTQMTPFLNVLGYLPIEQPYNTTPWNYNGDESVVAIPNFNVIDWVLVEILQPEIAGEDTSFVLVARKAGFILSNGTIKDLDGTSLLLFPGLSLTDFYVRIIHRNHLQITSAVPLTQTGGIFNYDFSTGPNQVMGGTHSLKQLATTIWGMIAGDGNGNGQIDNLDKDDVWLSQQNLTGYYSGDYNMESQVNEDDKIVKWEPNSGKGAYYYLIIIPANLPPSAPSAPQPPDGAVNQPINTTLAWTCSDPENDPLTYDVYFGISNPPSLVSSGQTGSNYNPGILLYNTQYFWKIVAHDDHSNSTEGAVWTFTTLSVPTWHCGDPMTDVRDNQIYNTVEIGTQCWMAENLNIGTMIPGSTEMTNNNIIEKYCYENNTANCDTYGGLYQWNEMMQYSTTPGVQGICPVGWHLPTDAEWTILTTFLGGESVAGGKMKTTGTIEAGTGLWYAPNTGATNESGFSVLPGGFRYLNGSFYYLGYYALFWSSTEFDTNNAWLRFLYFNYTDVYTLYDNKYHGFSSRCVQD